MNQRDPNVFALRVSSKQLPDCLSKAISGVLGWILGFKRFNEFYRQLPVCSPSAFPAEFLKAMNLRLELDGRALERVPRNGPLLIIANHPFGLMEGIALDARIHTIRSDVTVMAHHWFSEVPELAARWFFVDPTRNRRRRGLSQKGWLAAFRWLAAGHSLIVFPAGRVARFRLGEIGVREMPWSTHIAAIARRAGAAVLPIHVHGRGGIYRHMLGVILPQAHDYLVIRELNAMRNWKIRATVGDLVTAQQLSQFSTDEEATQFLRGVTLDLVPS